MTTQDLGVTPTKENGNQVVTEMTVGSATSMSQCTMNKSEFGSSAISLCADEEEDNFVHKCVMKQMMEHLQGTWYGWRKFIPTDKLARTMMKDTCQNKKSMMPVSGCTSKEMFIKKCTPAIKTAMSQLRRNSQTLAQRNHMGEFQSMSKAFAPFFKITLFTN